MGKSSLGGCRDGSEIEPSKLLEKSPPSSWIEGFAAG
jgi:hypothetical protein